MSRICQWRFVRTAFCCILTGLVVCAVSYLSVKRKFDRKFAAELASFAKLELSVIKRMEKGETDKARLLLVHGLVPNFNQALEYEGYEIGLREFLDETSAYVKTLDTENSVPAVRSQLLELSEIWVSSK